MDNQKDKKIQNLNIENKEVSQKTTEPIAFFGKDQSFVFVYKKTEKLATALYMVTNLFSDSEPMKWSLRKKVAELLSFMIEYKNVLPTQHFDFTNNTKTRVLEIVSMLEISYRSGLVSPMNFSILKEEFSLLISTLDNATLSHSESHHQNIPNSFFSVPPVSQKNESYISDKKDNYVLKDNNEHLVFKKNNRQNIIIQLLKKKKDLTIKDISQTIRDCSEKTIQRELIDLIKTGIIKKTGERRWSRYSLV